jgi:hypothetical protein
MEMERTVQQMLQQLLAIQEKADQKQMLAEIIAKLHAETKAIQARTKAMRDKRIEANMKDDRKATTACQDAMEASLRNIEPNTEEKETVLARHEIPKEEVAVHSETAASQEAAETKPNPGKMQSVQEHQEILKEDAVVMPVGEPRKRRRDWNLAAGRRQKPK